MSSSTGSGPLCSNSRTNTPKKEAVTAPEGPKPLSKNEINRRRRRIDEVEAKILELESTKDTALQEMGSPDLDNDRRRQLAHICSGIDTELETAFANWEKWSLEIEQGVTERAPGKNTE